METYCVAHALLSLKSVIDVEPDDTKSVLTEVFDHVLDQVDTGWSGDPELLVFLVGTLMLLTLALEPVPTVMEFRVVHDAKRLVVDWVRENGCDRELAHA